MVDTSPPSWRTRPAAADALPGRLTVTTSTELPSMLGRSTRELGAELGEQYRRVVVHRDDLAVL